ncbi:MAG: patatin-like phospholipase family protein [Saprospiraceae bacterium]|nr:patatin-like phospholipase family protein [Saprospiraceae bacterium]
MKQTLLLAFSLLLSSALFSQTRPKIGLALSGGGAKGLAHVGVLKAIDSAGLHIDYVTGTSMGSVVGSLYSIGYSADSIEKLARDIDWSILLSNQTTLRSLIMEEKDEYGKYTIELAWDKNGLRLPTGVLEGQELWIKLGELFSPAYNIQDFSKFPIPFLCIATDIATGEAVVLDSGSLVTAVRASMAIPTVFTAVEIDGRKLVDGGIVHNFPVRELTDLGADFIIGSSVSSGLLQSDEVTDVTSILMQVMFLADGLQHREEAANCNVYIEHPLKGYSAASFSSGNLIMNEGVITGRELYPFFKNLADSLDAIYGKPEPYRRLIGLNDSIYISEVVVHGLENSTLTFFQQMTGLFPGKAIAMSSLSERIRRVFGTRFYERIIYDIEPVSDGGARIVFNVIENPSTFVKLGIHYNTFSNIALIANLTSRNLLTLHSRSMLSLNISENFRAKAEYLQLLGKNHQWAQISRLQFERFEFTNFQDLNEEGLFRQNYLAGDLDLQYSSKRRFTIGAGLRAENFIYKPIIESQLDLKGHINQYSAPFYYRYHTLEAQTYPKNGVRLETELSYIFKQYPDIEYQNSGENITNLDSLGIAYNNFPRGYFSSEWYVPMQGKWNFQSLVQVGANFNYKQRWANDFNVGGLTRLYRNQIVFAGLPHGSLFTPSVAALQLGLRYSLLKTLHFTARANGLVHNFISRNENIQVQDFLSGYALTAGYTTALGPIELSGQYSDQTGKFSAYVNLGFAF